MQPDADELRLCGIRQGRLLAGPETLQINLTNACNLDCVFCWNHSALRPNPSDAWHRQRLSPAHLENILAALPRLAPSRVLLSGRGEPLLHPGIRDLLATLRDHAIPTAIQTNGSTGPGPDELAALGVDHLLVNVSAATEAGWAATHPTRARLHAVVLERLEQLAQLHTPAVTLVAVIQRSNHQELLPLWELALRVKARGLQLKGLEPQPGLEPLRLDAGQTERVRADLHRVTQRAAQAGLELRAEHLQRLLDRDSARFSRELSHGPCYMGWYHLRVTCDGRVMFCCKDKLVDHLDRRPLYAIWRSAAYHLLRLSARDGDLDGPFDDKCGGCSNFQRNHEIARDVGEHTESGGWS